MPSSCSITCEHVTIHPLEHTTLPTIHLQIQAHHQIALVGKDEAQKNALLELLAGKIRPSQGRMHYAFADEYLSTQDPLHTYKSAFDLIAYVRMHHHFRNKSNTQTFYYQQRFNADDAARVDTVAQYLAKIPNKNPQGPWHVENVLPFLSLTHLANESLIKLSNGETRRLMLAAALVKNPKLLILDRPLIGLDVQSRADFAALLQKMVDTGHQLILHVSPQEIPACITHILEIKEDEIRYYPKAELPAIDLIEKNSEVLLTESQKQVLRDLIPLDVKESNSPSPLVEMQQVTVNYGEKTILDQIHWRIFPREIWALQGHNGAGKSTLLSLINGDHPQAYRNPIYLFGQKRGSGESIWDIKKKIGYVSPEFHQFFPKNQTCMQVILSGLFDTAGLFRKPTENQIAKGMQWLELFGLEPYRTKPLALLAPDQQRLCLLARALIKHPPLLILDEPVQGLSQKQRDFFKALIDHIAEISTTAIIYVSHYAEDLPSSINRVLHLEQGKVISNTVEISEQN